MKLANGTKKTLALLIGLVMLFCASVPALAADEYDTANAYYFTFSDDGITVTREGSGGKYKIEGTALTIQKSGTYVVTGSCADGSIKVKKETADVTLVLNGLTLTSSTTAPICCNKQTEVTIIAAARTGNTLTDSARNNDDKYPDNADTENAVIKCKDGSNVTLCGKGSINVTAYGKNGVKGGYDLYEEDDAGNATDTLLSEASLTVRDLTLHITVALTDYKDTDGSYIGDALKSDKELNILSGIITVSATDDGIKSDYVLNIGAEGTEGPTINVTKSYEGIEAATINVCSGNITVKATDDGINAANGDLTNYDYSYNQYGGSVYVDCENGDGIDSNGVINFNGGVFEVHSPSMGDGDPIDGDGRVNLNGATVLAVGHNAMQNGYTGTYVTFGGKGGMFSAGSTLAKAGDTIEVKDASGATVYTAIAVRNASYIAYTDADMAEGGSYTLYVNGSKAATATAGSNTQQGGPGGPGGPGGGFPGGQPGGQGAGTNLLSSILNWFRNIINWFKNLLSF